MIFTQLINLISNVFNAYVNFPIYYGSPLATWSALCVAVQFLCITFVDYSILKMFAALDQQNLTKLTLNRIYWFLIAVVGFLGIVPTIVLIISIYAGFDNTGIKLFAAATVALSGFCCLCFSMYANAFVFYLLFKHSQNIKRTWQLYPASITYIMCMLLCTVGSLVFAALLAVPSFQLDDQYTNTAANASIFFITMHSVLQVLQYQNTLSIARVQEKGGAVNIQIPRLIPVDSTSKPII
jgi:hypothetical protein